eukprot:7752500-Alexandrium_andersonii.AAC.1
MFHQSAPWSYVEVECDLVLLRDEAADSPAVNLFFINWSCQGRVSRSSVPCVTLHVRVDAATRRAANLRCLAWLVAVRRQARHQLHEFGM